MGLIFSIIIAIITASCVKNKVYAKEDFNGVAWGLINGILGVGVLPAIVAHSSINGVITKCEDESYKQYALGQMKSFTATYVFCLVIWILIAIAIYASNM